MTVVVLLHYDRRSLRCEATVIACYNAPDGLTLSGPAPEISEIKTHMTAAGLFFRDVATDGIAYHSPLIAPYKVL